MSAEAGWGPAGVGGGECAARLVPEGVDPELRCHVTEHVHRADGEGRP
jgi:hypothetical protein